MHPIAHHHGQERLVLAALRREMREREGRVVREMQNSQLPLQAMTLQWVVTLIVRLVKVSCRYLVN